MTPGQRRYNLAAYYRKASRGLGDGCPIEAGIIGRLADNECPHGNLPTDHRIDCTCFPRRRP